MKAGAFTPAIPGEAGGHGETRSPPSALNEGGGFHPRNPCCQPGFIPSRSYDRSMKAGAFTPAIHRGPSPIGMRPGRSMKAGAFTPAIQGRHAAMW